MRRESSRGGLVPALYTLSGLLTLLVGVEGYLVARGVHELPRVFLSATIAGAPFIVGIGFGAFWLGRSELSRERDSRIAWWVLGAVTGFLVLMLILIIGTPPVTVTGVLTWARLAVSIGGGVGLLVGILEGRAIEREVQATHATVRAQEADTRRELLDYLNGLLRHEVLNTAAVIDGYVELLDDEIEDSEATNHLQVIKRQSEDLTSVITDVRILLDASRGTATLQPIELIQVIREEVDTLREVEPAVEVDAFLPDEVYVQADQLLHRIFANLLDNAVTHNDSEEPIVRVLVNRHPEHVEIRIEDDGPGVPAEKQESLFEHETMETIEHGLGLSIVATLVERYGGEIELSETGDDGSVFTVDLLRTEPDSPVPGSESMDRKPSPGAAQ